MNRYEKIYLKATEKHEFANWMDTAIAALAVDLEEATGEPVKISGPYGLRAAVRIDVGSHYINITASFGDRDFKLYYDTGETRGKYAPGTLGDYNGFNNVEAALPDTIEEIIALLKPLYGEGAQE